MGGIVLLLVILMGIVIFVFQSESHNTRIENKIHEYGGTLINYERRNIFTGIGPFMVVGKGRTVYRIEYEMNGERKEGWVRFGGITGPDWRL